MADAPTDTHASTTDTAAILSRLDKIEAAYAAKVEDEEIKGDPKEAAGLRTRLADVTKQRRELIAELGQLRGMVQANQETSSKALQDAQSAHEKALTEAQESHAAQLLGLNSVHSDDLRLSDSGIRDELGRSAVRQAFGLLPEDQRQDKTSADYWEGLVTAARAHKQDPDKNAAPAIPRTLIAYLPGDVTGQHQRDKSVTEATIVRNHSGQVTAQDIANAKNMKELQELLSKAQQPAKR